MQHQDTPEEAPIVESQVGDAEKGVQQEENESFFVSLGRTARSSLNLIALLVLAFAVNEVAKRTGQQEEGWVKFLIDKTTLFAMWGIVVLAGCEFLKVCAEGSFSLLERIMRLYTRFRQLKR